MRAAATRLWLLAAGALAALAGAALLSGGLPLGERSRTPRVLPEIPATAMHQGRGIANNSPMLLADPTEPRFVVMANRLDAPAFGCALQVSGNGGRTFVTARPVRELPAGADTCYAPEVAFDRRGTLYYLFVGLHGSGNEPMGVFLTTSSDRGRSFAPPRRVLGPFNYAVRMAVDPSRGFRGRLHLVWLRATSDPPLGGFGPPPNPILASHSDDGGRTFSGPVQVSDPGRRRVVAPSLAVDPRGAVHVAYYDLQDDARDYQGLEGPVWDGRWSIVATRSTDGGRQFGPGQVVDDEVAPHERVMLVFTMPPPSVVAGDDGRTCVAWTDARRGDADAVLRCSGDGGATWGGLARLNDDPLANGRTQDQPRLGLAPDGRLDAVFYDRRRDPENVLNEVSYTFSVDGGRSFAANRILTRDPSNTQIGQRYANESARGLVEFGSRIGLLSREGGAVAAWTDTRNSRPGTGQDVFATVIEFPELPQPAWARALGGVLIALGAVPFALGRWTGRRREESPGGARP